MEDVQPAYNVSKLTALDAKLDRARKARVFCERNVQENGAGQQVWWSLTHNYILTATDFTGMDFYVFLGGGGGA